MAALQGECGPPCETNHDGHHRTHDPSRRRPPEMVRHRVIRSPTARSCVATTPTACSSAQAASIKSTTTFVASSSSIPVGSSATTKRGRVTNARAIPTRCLSPPDNWSGWAWARCVKPSRSRMPEARFIESALDRPRSRSGRATFSAADISGNSSPCWNTIPMVLRRNSDRSFSRKDDSPTESTTIRPDAGVANPAIQLSNEVFPEPDGPIRATTSPGSARKSTSSSKVRPGTPTLTPEI